MKIVQGFVTISQYVSNVPGIISPVGELSTYSRTYSKEKGEYRKLDIPGYQLITFKSIESTTGLEVEVPSTLADEILAISRAVVAYAVGHMRPYDPEDFRNTLETENALVIDNLELGPFEQSATIDLPQFITWKSLGHANSEVRIWFSDSAFSDQYSGYEITVIPPLPVLNDFFLPFSNAKVKIEEQGIVALGEKIQAAKMRHPETVVRLLEFNFVNRHDPAVTTKTTWGVLVYGKEGDYIDAIKDAISEYLLANSTHALDQWEIIFPDIFKRTEMVVVPRWDKVAVENLTDHSSLYSSIASVSETQTFLQSFVNFYSGGHVSVNSYVVPYPFKTLSLGVVNGTNNMDGKKDFKQVFPDYLPIPSTSLDFARMTLKTQALILFLDDILIWAEKVTPISPLPQGMRRVTRNNKLFVSSSLDGINYLVAAKFNQEFN